MRFFFTFSFLTAILSSTVNTQVTFNKRFHFDYLAAVMTSIIPTDSCYYGTGILADTIPPYNTGNIFIKFDLVGNPVYVKTLADTDKTYESWFNTLRLLNDSSFVVTAFQYDGIANTLLIKYDFDGDTLFTRQYTNPYFPQFDWIQPRGGMIVTPDNGLIISNWVAHGEPSNPNTEVYVVKLDQFGDIVWERTFESPLTDRPASSVLDPNGNPIFGWVMVNTNQVLENFTSQIKLVKVDPLGETIWEYLSPEIHGLRDAPNDMILLGDGSLVIATGKGTEIERPSSNTIWYEKLLIKLSPDLDIVWARVFNNPGPANSQSKLTNVIEVSDGSGYVTAGRGSKLEMNTLRIHGWLAKVAPDGETLWTRSYLGIGGSSPFHEIYDLKECPDGGFIIAGESQDGTWETLPPQQAWLLKLDQHGCLVPGCHLLDDVGETMETDIELAIYPNPTTDYLNFQLRGRQLPKEGVVRIVDANGRVVESQVVPRVNIEDTFIVPVRDWAVGAYFLQYLDGENEVVVSEKFIKL